MQLLVSNGTSLVVYMCVTVVMFLSISGNLVISHLQAFVVIQPGSGVLLSSFSISIVVS